MTSKRRLKMFMQLAQDHIGKFKGWPMSTSGYKQAVEQEELKSPMGSTTSARRTAPQKTKFQAIKS